jgi:hypothetical protein
MSTTTQSPLADYDARRAAAERRSQTARKAAETREKNKREQRAFEQSQKNKRAYLYESTLTREQRAELESSPHEMKFRFDAKAEKFQSEQELFVTASLKDAAITYGWNQVRAAIESYDAPTQVHTGRHYIAFEDVLDELLLRGEFANVDGVMGNDVPELLWADRTSSDPELPCSECGTTISKNEYRSYDGDDDGALCEACGDKVAAEDDAATAVLDAAINN